jgi:DNA repair exonuclease SbcCD ATPase subunit
MSKSIVSAEEQIYKKWAAHLDTLSEKDKDGDKWVETRNAEKVLREALSQFKESQPTGRDGGYPNPNTAETEIQKLNEHLTEFAQIIDKKNREIERLKVCSEARKREILRIREESNEAIEQLQERLNNQQQPTEVEKRKEAFEGLLLDYASEAWKVAANSFRMYPDAKHTFSEVRQYLLDYGRKLFQTEQQPTEVERMKWVRAAFPPKDDKEVFVRFGVKKDMKDTAYYEDGQWRWAATDKILGPTFLHTLEWLDESNTQADEDVRDYEASDNTTNHQ